jgi:4-hydroxy-tetrahydrodipicolinate reductase
MRLAIIGYGRLGKAVGEAWTSAGDVVVKTVGSENAWDAADLKADIVFESSTPESAADNIIACVNAGLPVVVGTTGWHDRLDEISSVVESEGGLLFHATNLSIGVHLMNQFAENMARVLSSFEDYSPSIIEAHHIHKLDKPSGTAITLSDKVKAAGGFDAIQIESVREGEIVGMHEMVWSSDIDAISIKHEASSRLGFALGAVRSAKWLLDKRAEGSTGVFSMDNMIKEII